MIAITEDRAVEKAPAFEAFFTQEYTSVYRAAYLATGSTDAAQDVAQEAFARAFARWGRLKKESWAGGWVMTTALNLCKRKLPRHLPLTTDVADTPAAPHVRVDLSSQLRSLPARQRTAIVLFYIGDLPVGQIAHLMRISEGTVKAHLAQAREALRKSMEVSDV